MSTPVNDAPLRQPPAPVPGWNPDAQIVQVFAEANGWQYFPLATAQPLPGIVFRERDGRPRFTQRAVNIVRIPGPPLTEIGNSFYTEIAAGNQFTQAWGYVALQVDAALPALVVQSARLARRSALPSLPATTAVPLGGDERFTLYADPTAAAWAAAVFDAQIRDLLDDGSLGFHVEIVGGWVFLYAPHPLAVPDPAVWSRVLELVTALRVRLGQPAPAAGAPLPAAGVPDPVAAPYATVPAGGGLPMRSNGAAVNGRRVWWIWGAVIAGMIVAGGASALISALR